MNDEVRAATVVARTDADTGLNPQDLICMAITARYFQLVRRNKAALLGTQVTQF